MAKNGRRNEGNGLEDRFLELKKLPSAELRKRLDVGALSKRERTFVQNILRDCPIVWTSGNRTTTVKREPESPDFKIQHKCLGGIVEQRYTDYKNAVSDAAWICGEKI